MEHTEQVKDKKQSQQQRIIPESRRPDGTIRRARKIRNGYVPLEEQKKYQSPAIRRMQQTINPPNVPVKPNSQQSQPKPLKQDNTLQNTDTPKQTPSESSLKPQNPNVSQSAKKPEKYIPPFMRKKMEDEKQAHTNETNALEKQTKDTKTNALANENVAKVVESMDGLSLDQTKNK